MPSFSIRPTSIPTREIDRAEEAAVRAEVAAEKVEQTIDLATQLIKDVADAREEMIPITSQIETVPGVINAAVNTINNTRTEAVQSINASTEAAQEGISMQTTGALSAISSQEVSSRSAVMSAGMNELGNIAGAADSILADIDTAKTEAIEAIEEAGDTTAITTALTEATSALSYVTDAIDEANETLSQMTGIDEKLSQLDEAVGSLSPVDTTWIQGYYGYSGNFSNLDYRVATRDLIPCKYNDIVRVDGVATTNPLWHLILIYDSDGNLLGDDSGLNNPISYDGTFYSPISFQNAAYIRISCGNMGSGSGTFSPSNMTNAHIWIDSANNRINKIAEALSVVTREVTAYGLTFSFFKYGRMCFIHTAGQLTSNITAEQKIISYPAEMKPIRGAELIAVNGTTGSLLGRMLVGSDEAEGVKSKINIASGIYLRATTCYITEN